MNAQLIQSNQTFSITSMWYNHIEQGGVNIIPMLICSMYIYMYICRNTMWKKAAAANSPVVAGGTFLTAGWGTDHQVAPLDQDTDYHRNRAWVQKGEKEPPTSETHRKPALTTSTAQHTAVYPSLSHGTYDATAKPEMRYSIISLLFFCPRGWLNILKTGILGREQAGLFFSFSFFYVPLLLGRVAVWRVHPRVSVWRHHVWLRHPWTHTALWAHATFRPEWQQHTPPHTHTTWSARVQTYT